MLREEFQLFTATARPNGLFRKDTETSTEIQKKPSAAHLRFSSEETTYKCISTSAAQLVRTALPSDLSYSTFLTWHLKPALEWLYSLESYAWRQPQPPSLPWEDKQRTCTAPHTPSWGSQGTLCSLPVPLPTCPDVKSVPKLLPHFFHYLSNCFNIFWLQTTKASYLIFNQSPTWAALFFFPFPFISGYDR